ncbi:hypothetical protein FHG87_024029 [Trinorchestia longiramus]|nr:hypothetical protein FHG87_024029 [Trinorchestia longiramus]
MTELVAFKTSHHLLVTIPDHVRSPRQRLLLTNNQRATCTCAASRAHNHSNDTYTTGLNPQLTLPRIISPSSSGVAVEVPITSLYIMPQIHILENCGSATSANDLGTVLHSAGLLLAVLYAVAPTPAMSVTKPLNEIAATVVECQ